MQIKKANSSVEENQSQNRIGILVNKHPAPAPLNDMDLEFLDATHLPGMCKTVSYGL